MYKNALFFLLIILVLSSTICYAHPGGTDGSGGHTDHSTGEYHYHHGFPAHDHVDGVCPYGSEYNSYQFEEGHFDFYDFLNLLDNPVVSIIFLFILVVITYFLMYLYECHISYRIIKLRDKSKYFDNMCNTFSRLVELVKAFVPVILLLSFIILGTIGWLIELFE